MAKKSFNELTERDILALAIQLEEEDSRVYGDFAEGLREKFPATATSFDEMQAEESRHRQRLIDMYRKRFGEHIPLIRRDDMKGFIERRPVWLVRPLAFPSVGCRRVPLPVQCGDPDQQPADALVGTGQKARPVVAGKADGRI